MLSELVDIDSCKQIHLQDRTPPLVVSPTTLLDGRDDSVVANPVPVLLPPPLCVDRYADELLAAVMVLPVIAVVVVVVLVLVVARRG